MKFSKIFTSILILSSFLPIIQIIFLYINGGILSFTETITKINIDILSNILNLTFVILTSILYFRSNKLILKIISSILVYFFMLSFITFLKINNYGNEEGALYFLPFLIAGISTGIIIIGIDKYKLNKVTI